MISWRWDPGIGVVDRSGAEWYHRGVSGAIYRGSVSKLRGMELTKRKRFLEEARKLPRSMSQDLIWAIMEIQSKESRGFLSFFEILPSVGEICKIRNEYENKVFGNLSLSIVIVIAGFQKVKWRLVMRLERRFGIDSLDSEIYSFKGKDWGIGRMADGDYCKRATTLCLLYIIVLFVSFSQLVIEVLFLLVNMTQSSLIGSADDGKNGEGTRKRLKILVPHFDNSALIKSYSKTIIGGV